MSQAQLKGGNGKGLYLHLLDSTVSLRIAGPAPVLAHKCGIHSLFLLGDFQTTRDRHSESTSHSHVLL